jgi:hypothetical protein
MKFTTSIINYLYHLPWYNDGCAENAEDLTQDNWNLTVIPDDPYDVPSECSHGSFDQEGANV